LLYASRKYSLYKQILNWCVISAVDWSVDNFHMQYLGAFAKLLKVTVSFITNVRLSVCPHIKSRLPREGFSWKLMFKYFLKTCLEYSSFIKIWQEKRVLLMKTDVCVWSYIPILLRMRNFSDKHRGENQNNFMFH
jgi:hypothetical protein